MLSDLKHILRPYQRSGSRSEA